MRRLARMPDPNGEPGAALHVRTGEPDQKIPMDRSRPLL
jgi:hypothetical protein